MEQDDKLIYTSKMQNYDRLQEHNFFESMDEYDEIYADNEPLIHNNYIAYGYIISRKDKKIDFLVSTTKLKEVIWYFSYQINTQIAKQMEWFVVERRNQFIIEIYDNGKMFGECCVRKLTKEGNRLLDTLKGDTKIIASPYSQNLKFINFLTKKSA